MSNEPICPDDETPLQGNATQDIQYVVDKHDKLVAVNEAWDDFALCNGAQGLMSEWVIGRDWRDFVQGDTTRMYMEAMLNAARILGKRVGHSYRCDSPQEKRYIKLTVDPLPDGQVVFRHHTTKVEEQKYVVDFFVPKAPVKGVKPIKRCSMCNQVFMQGEWREVEAAVDAGLLQNCSSVPVFYAICPKCHAKVRRIPSGEVE